MSKIFLIGDSHIAKGYPNKSDEWFKVHKEYFKDFLIPLLKKEVSEGDIIVHLGDLFDNRDIIPINLLNFAMDQVIEISKIAPFHMIVGNHDCWSRSSDEINTIRPFKYIPNVHVYDSVESIDFNDKKLLMMPYLNKKKDQIRHINDNKDCNYIFCHSDLNGARMHLSSVGHKNNNKIDVDEFKGFDGVYSGHIHIVQRSKNFVFVGSNFQMDRNDYNDTKGIFVIDTDTNKEEFYENNISPIYKKVEIVNEGDIDKLEELKDSKDYIDISVSNNLLISNRKLRRKLEILLEQGNFASIEYIDDITKDGNEEESEELNESLSDDDLDISIELDYSKYIKNYIKKKNYESDKFKNGVLEEYNDIIDVYNKNYNKE